MRLPVRTPFAGRRDARLPGLPPRAGRRGRRTAAGTPAPSTCPTAAAPSASSWRPARRPDRGGGTGFVTRRRSRLDGPARHERGRHERIRRLLDADCDPRGGGRRTSATTPVLGTGGPRHPRAAGPRPGRRRRDRRSAPCIGQQVSVAGRAHGRRAARGRAWGEPVDVRRPRADPPLPVAAPRSPSGRPESPADAARARSGARRAGAALADGRGRSSTAAPTATTYAGAAGAARASARGRRTTSRCGRSATPTSSCRPTSAVRDALTALGHDPRRAAEPAERWRPWRSYAQVHLWNTLMPTPDRPRRGELTCGP